MTTSSDPKSAPEGSARDAFMSVDELRQYATQVEMARASKAVDSMDQAGKARAELIKRLSTPIKLTPEIGERLRGRLKSAAASGKSELEVMRFPVDLCTDRGRAINNSEAGWPDTLIGVPRQAYEVWQQYLQPAGYRLKAMIVEWPHGLPGDVGLILSWGDEKHR